jgi:hypothetical protein
MNFASAAGWLSRSHLALLTGPIFPSVDFRSGLASVVTQAPQAAPRKPNT